MSIPTKVAGFLACLKFDNPLQLIVSRLIFRKSRFVAHRWNGLQFIADQEGGDECGLRPCLVEGMYDPFIQATGIFQSHAPLNIADFGANAGGFSLLFAMPTVKIKKLIAVEMNPLTPARMRLNLLTNFGPKAIPINAAVGGCSMSLNVPFTSGGTGDRIHLSRSADDSSFSVPMRTLDDLLNAEFPGQKIDLLKMDIEGCEWDVLETGQCERLRDCHHLLIEVHPHSGRGITDFQKAVKPYGLELREVRNAGAEDVFLFSQNAIASSESGANH